MKLNTEKCHLLLNGQEPNTLKIGDLNINNSLSEKLLDITFEKLAVEMFQVSRCLNPEIAKELFQLREQMPYELRQRPQFQIPWVHSVFSGTECLKFLGPDIWALVPNEMKQLGSLGKFSNAIKQWKPISCPCRLCKRYIHRIGFL